jgi:hypothetical protein
LAAATPGDATRRPFAYWALGLSGLVYALVLASIWGPELAHWHVWPGTPSPAQQQKLRQAPSLPQLQEIAAMQLRGVMVPASDAVAAADLALQGQLKLPTFEAQPIQLPFSGSDLERGSAIWQLMFATLASADVLLDGYLASGKEAHFDMARRVLLGFAQYESARWLDKGMLWNDHAVSARVPVLVKFWAVLRQRGTADAEAEQAVLSLAARSAVWLAKPASYAWRTSHGIISDLALLQLAAAFPDLPEAAAARRVGASRFANHLEYWVNQEGVTLLHSAGYHVGSMYHLSLGLRLFTLNGLDIPADWWHRFDQALRFMALLKRPDGTLPMFGDTANLPASSDLALTSAGPDGRALPLAIRAVPSNRNAGLYPSAGHLVWWDTGAAAQTVATWAYHPGLGHKLADELSVLFWAEGQTWVTNTGYWPYDVPGREQAEGWDGSNAPHVLGELKGSQRSSQVLAYGDSPALRFADMERRGPDGLVLRRQLLRLANSNAWVVLDHASDPLPRPWVTHWTFDPALSLSDVGRSGEFDLRAAGSATRLRVGVASAEQAAVKPVRGSQQPWGGWAVSGRAPVPAQSLAIQQPAGSAWQLTTFALLPNGDGKSPGAGPRMERWNGAEHWTVSLPTAAGTVTLARDDQQIVQSLGSDPTHPEPGSELKLQSVPAAASDRTASRMAFDAAARSFKRFPEVVDYRIKVSLALLLAMALQEAALAIIWRHKSPLSAGLRVASWGAWMAGAVWLAVVYFAPR